MHSSEAHATAGPQSTAGTQQTVSTAATSQQEASVVDALNKPVLVSGEGTPGQDAVLTCLPPAQGHQGLSTFLAAYGSDSDSDVN